MARCGTQQKFKKKKTVQIKLFAFAVAAAAAALAFPALAKVLAKGKCKIYTHTHIHIHNVRVLAKRCCRSRVKKNKNAKATSANKMANCCQGEKPSFDFQLKDGHEEAPSGAAADRTLHCT